MGRSWFVAAAATMVLCTPAEASEVAAPDTKLAPLPWLSLYQQAWELFQEGRREEAVTLFYIGQLRARVIVQCQNVAPDEEPAMLASFNATIGQAINEYAGGSPPGWTAAIDRALAWDADHPDPNATSAECRAERDRQRAGLTQLRDHITANADEIRRQRTANGLPNR